MRKKILEVYKGKYMTKIIEIESCRTCPFLRYPWRAAIGKTPYACGNSFEGTERPKGEKDWLGGDALPGDRIIDDLSKIPDWCKLKDK